MCITKLLRVYKTQFWFFHLLLQQYFDEILVSVWLTNYQTFQKHLIHFIRSKKKKKKGKKSRKICFRHALRRDFYYDYFTPFCFLLSLIYYLKAYSHESRLLSARFSMYDALFSFGKHYHSVSVYLVLTLPTHTIQHVHQRTYGDRY